MCLNFFLFYEVIKNRIESLFRQPVICKLREKKRDKDVIRREELCVGCVKQFSEQLMSLS